MTLLAKFKKNKAARNRLAASKKRRGAGGDLGEPRRYTGKNGLLRALLGVTVWFAVTASVLYQRPLSPLPFVVGQVADRDIYSEVPFEYVNIEQTESLREQAARQVPPVYRVDKERLESSLQFLTQLRDAVTATLAVDADENAEQTPAAAWETPSRTQSLLNRLMEKGWLGVMQRLFASQEKSRILQRLANNTMAQGVVTETLDDTFFSGMTPADQVYLLDLFERRSVRALSTFLTPGQASERIASEFFQQFPGENGQAQKALGSVLAEILQPNLVFDPEATAVAREQAAAEVPTVEEFLSAGVPLLRRGEEVMPGDILKLRMHSQALQKQRAQTRTAHDTVAVCLLILIIIGVAAVGLWVINPDAVYNRSTLALVTTVAVLQVAMSRISMDLYNMHYGTAVLLAVILPLSLGSILLAQLVGLRVALWFGVFAGLVAAMQQGGAFDIMVVGTVTSFAGAFLVRRACRRYHVFRAGLGVSVMLFITATAFVLSNGIPIHVLMPIAGIALINGIGTAVVASTILPLFEFIFGVTTDISLLELSDLNHPLLKRLQIEAPGTYHHSLMVATVAEQAAAAIGANPLLARVCAYFHDIGKIGKAEYFTENQALSGKSPHENLQPRMSTLVILNHVKEGLELAAQYKLKKVIREAISTHHGTSLVYYFYRRALDQNGESSGDKHRDQHDYRYPGPLPVRKEIAIIAIADSAEAASRSLEKPTPAKINGLVKEIVAKRIEDGQLDSADLTFRDLAVVRHSIVKTLTTMLHARIAYPKDEENADHPDSKNAKGAPRESSATPESAAPGSDPVGAETP